MHPCAAVVLRARLASAFIRREVSLSTFFIVIDTSSANVMTFDHLSVACCACRPRSHVVVLRSSQTGRFADEEKVTFENLVEGITTDNKLNSQVAQERGWQNVEHLRKFFGFDRAVDITVDG